MDKHLETTFKKTIQGYAQGFHVRQIATFGLATCTKDEKVEKVDERLPSFDQVPVIENEIIIGVLEKGDKKISGLVSENMRRLDDSLLVAAEEPLNDFLPNLAKPPFYKLVLEGSKITGIVTRSDMLKLPVRLYGFALVTNLELVMTEIIQSHFEKDEEWLIFLTDDQQKTIKRQKRNYEKQRMDPPLIEMTNFGHKISILEKLLIYPGFFINELRDIEKELRNPLAHSVAFAPDENKLKRFVDLTRLTQNWTNKLLTYLVDEKKGKLC